MRGRRFEGLRMSLGVKPIVYGGNDGISAHVSLWDRDIDLRISVG